MLIYSTASRMETHAIKKKKNHIFFFLHVSHELSAYASLFIASLGAIGKAAKLSTVTKIRVKELCVP